MQIAILIICIHLSIGLYASNSNCKGHPESAVTATVGAFNDLLLSNFGGTDNIKAALRNTGSPISEADSFFIRSLSDEQVRQASNVISALGTNGLPVLSLKPGTTVIVRPQPPQFVTLSEYLKMLGGIEAESLLETLTEANIPRPDIGGDSSYEIIINKATGSFFVDPFSVGPGLTQQFLEHSIEKIYTGPKIKRRPSVFMDGEMIDASVLLDRTNAVAPYIPKLVLLVDSGNRKTVLKIYYQRMGNDFKSEEYDRVTRDMKREQEREELLSKKDGRKNRARGFTTRITADAAYAVSKFDYIEGISLHQLHSRVHDRKSWPAIAHSLIGRVKNQLDAGILNTDIKPGNVILEEGTGDTILLDMESAYTEDEAKQPGIIYTRAYLAPENRKPIIVYTKESVLWATGITLAECIGLITKKEMKNEKMVLKDFFDVDWNNTNVLWYEQHSPDLLELIRILTSAQPKERLKALKIF